MNITGSTTLSADRATVWRALNDPAVLVASIPGCQRLEAFGEDAYKMTVAAGVGAIKGVYDGEVRLTDQQEPGSFRMHCQGAGAPGTIGAQVSVRLADAPGGGTALSYEADAVVGGMIGGVGQRMLTGVSRKMAEEFFANVDTVLAGGAAPPRPRRCRPRPHRRRPRPPLPGPCSPRPAPPPRPAPGSPSGWPRGRLPRSWGRWSAAGSPPAASLPASDDGGET